MSPRLQLMLAGVVWWGIIAAVDLLLLPYLTRLRIKGEGRFVTFSALAFVLGLVAGDGLYEYLAAHRVEPGITAFLVLVGVLVGTVRGSMRWDTLQGQAKDGRAA